MPIARFQMPDGRIARFEVPEGTTPEQAQVMIQQSLAQQQGAAPQPQSPQPQVAPQQNIQALLQGLQQAESTGDFKTAIALRDQLNQLQGQAVGGTLEAAGTIASGIAAEPLAGLAGIGAALTPGGQTGAQAVESTREALTFQPKTQAGQQQLQSIGETLQPVAEAFETVEGVLGETTLELTGSPALAAAAATLPTAALELLGLGAGRRTAKTATGLQAKPSKIPAPNKVKANEVSKAMIESAPEVQQLKDVSRGIYKEIADVGVTIEPNSYKRLVKNVVKTAQDARVNKNLSPKAFGVAQEFQKELRDLKGKTFEDIDDLRKLAQDSASSIDPADARIGLAMIDEIDSFLDNVKPESFKGPNANAVKGVGEKYKAARNLWGRARRAELMEEVFDKAGRQASGLENGLRTNLRAILNNKKRSKFFTKDELGAMDDVVKGTNEQNVLKLVGRLGFSEGGATNVLGGLAGLSVLGPVATVAGTASRKLAQRATRKGFDVSDAIIRAGSDGKKITEAYLQVTPKAQRNAAELSELLLDPQTDLSAMLDSADKVVKEAAEIARGRRAFETRQAAGVLAPAVSTQQEQK